MKKLFRADLRVDYLTSELVVALGEKLGTDDKSLSKNEVYRTAIYHLAKERLTEEEFQAIVLLANDIEN